MPARLAGIEIVRSGGVAGLLRRRSLDPASLTEAQRKALAALADAKPAPSAGGADRFSFALTLRFEDGTTRAVTVAEDAVPETLADILR